MPLTAVALKHDGRHRNLWQLRELPFILLKSRVARRIAVPGSIAVECRRHPIRVMLVSRCTQMPEMRSRVQILHSIPGICRAICTQIPDRKRCTQKG
jgi:hypothetical protein